MRWPAISLLLTLGLACGQTKVVVNAVTVRGVAAEGEGDAVSRAVTGALAALDSLQVTTVHSAEGLASRHAGYSLGELAPQIAAATGADWVLFPALSGDAERLLSLAAYDRAAKTIRLFEPLLLPIREPERRDAVADAVTLAWQRWQAAAGTVAAVDVNGWLGIRLQASPGAGDGPFRIAVQPAALLVETTGEQIAPPPLTVATGTLVRTDDAVAWFKLSESLDLEPGTAVIVAPEAALPAPGSGAGAVLTSRPRAAEVVAAGRTWGVTPLWLPYDALAGQDLELRHPGALPWRRDIAAGDLATGLLAAELPLASDAPVSVRPTGVRLRIESIPPGAEVRLDGVPKGLTPLDLEGVIGRPQVTVHRTGFEVWRAQVVASGPLTLRAELVSAVGQLEVTSRPSRAEVYVDGQKQGLTPLGLSGIPVGKHEVRVVSPRGDEGVRQVMIEPAGVTRAEFRFPGGGEPGGEVVLPQPLQPDAKPEPAKPEATPEPVKPEAVPEPEPTVEPVRPPAVVKPAPEPPLGKVAPGTVASPRRPAPAPREPVAPQPFQPQAVPTAPEPDAPATAPDPKPENFRAGPILWQMKLDSLGGRLHLVAASYEDGAVCSITLSPPRTYLTGPIEHGLRLVYPGTNQTEGWAFALDEVPEIDAIRLEPDRSRDGALSILLDLASGVEAKIHPSSTLSCARIICRHPATSARPVVASEPQP